MSRFTYPGTKHLQRTGVVFVSRLMKFPAHEVLPEITTRQSSAVSGEESMAIEEPEERHVKFDHLPTSSEGDRLSPRKRVTSPERPFPPPQPRSAAELSSSFLPIRPDTTSRPQTEEHHDEE